MNIGKALLWGGGQLQHLNQSKLEVEVLLASVLKKDRVFLKTHLAFPLSWWEKILYKKCVQKRRQRIPMAYVLKYKDWAGFRIVVNKYVLIPRDETEILCEYILKAPRSALPQTILDVGTGSGCIALFLKRSWGEATVHALDTSSSALRVARKNSKKHILPIQFLKSDLLGNVPEKASYDIIIANLPYVPTNVKITREVEREPRRAIFSGADGLDHFRRLVVELETKQVVFRELWLEFLPQQEQSIEKIFSMYDVQRLSDAGKEIRFAKVMPNRKGKI